MGHVFKTVSYGLNTEHQRLNVSRKVTENVRRNTRSSLHNLIMCFIALNMSKIVTTKWFTTAHRKTVTVPARAAAARNPGGAGAEHERKILRATTPLYGGVGGAKWEECV